MRVFKKKFYLTLERGRERERESEREREKHQFVVPLIYAFIG